MEIIRSGIVVMKVNSVNFIKALILSEGQLIKTVEDVLLVDGISLQMVSLGNGKMEDALFIPLLPQRFEADEKLRSHFEKGVTYLEDEVDGEIGIRMNLTSFKNILEKVYSTSLTGEYASREFDGFDGFEAFFFTMV